MKKTIYIFIGKRLTFTKKNISLRSKFKSKNYGSIERREKPTEKTRKSKKI